MTTYYFNGELQQDQYFILQSHWSDSDWCKGPPQLINNVTSYLDAIWYLQSGNSSSFCGAQHVLDCSDPKICTSIIDPSIFIYYGLDTIYEGVTRSMMEAWVPKNQENDPSGLGSLPAEINGYNYCRIQENYFGNPFVSEFYLLSQEKRSDALCHTGFKCVNDSIEIYPFLDCTGNPSVLPLNQIYAEPWANAYQFSLLSTDKAKTEVAWTTFTPSYLVFAEFSKVAGVFQFLFYLAGGLLALYIFLLYNQKALEKKKILFKHAFFILSSFLWIGYIISQTMLLMYKTTDHQTTAILEEVSKLFLVLGSGATTATNAYNMQRVVFHENTQLNQILTGVLWTSLLILYAGLAGPYFFIYIYYTYQNLTLTQINLYNKWLLPVSGSWMIFCLAFDPFSCLAILTFIIHSMRSSMRDEPIYRAIYFLFGDKKLVNLVSGSIFILVLDVTLVLIKNQSLWLLNDYNNLFLDSVQSFIYILNAWISIMLIEHIPETIKRASIFTNPATKSMTSSVFGPKSTNVKESSYMPNPSIAASYVDNSFQSPEKAGVSSKK